MNDHFYIQNMEPDAPGYFNVSGRKFARYIKNMAFTNLQSEESPVGVILYIEVEDLGNDKYLLLNGNRRVEAARREGVTQIRVRCVNTDMVKVINVSQLTYAHAKH